MPAPLDEHWVSGHQAVLTLGPSNQAELLLQRAEDAPDYAKATSVHEWTGSWELESFEFTPFVLDNGTREYTYIMRMHLQPSSGSEGDEFAGVWQLRSYVADGVDSRPATLWHNDGPDAPWDRSEEDFPPRSAP